MSMTEECPFKHGKLRPELPPLIENMKDLPVDARGYPIPFFVAYVNGVPEFQMADEAKYKLAIIQKLCWVCGKKLTGHRKAFVIGPMCAINRVTSEPPTHLECANWSVRGCPFLAKPQMVRRENKVVDAYGKDAPGVMIERNPGVMCVWETNDWKMFNDGLGKGGKLIRLGNPVKTTWWREGRPATRHEILVSINTGYPVLLKGCHDSKQMVKLLEWQREQALRLLPP